MVIQIWFIYIYSYSIRYITNKIFKNFIFYLFIYYYLYYILFNIIYIERGMFSIEFENIHFLFIIYQIN
jgi:hypothetical protein